MSSRRPRPDDRFNPDAFEAYAEVAADFAFAVVLVGLGVAAIATFVWALL